MNTLQYVVQPVARELERVEACLDDQIGRIEGGHALRNSWSDSADRAVRHIFRTRGKRLRPLLFLLSARSAQSVQSAQSGEGGRSGGGGGTTDSGWEDVLVQIATAIELIHSASLVHDDVIDEAVLRRRRASVNKRYGNKIAVLSGDILFTQFYALVGSIDALSPEVRLALLALFTDVTRRMCFGQIFEEQMRRRPAASTASTAPKFEDYLDTIDNKTASLMSGCCEAGALVTGAPGGVVEALRGYGHHLGMAYQLFDDLDDRDGVYRDLDRIAAEADTHVKAALDMVTRLPESEATDRLGAIVSAIGPGVGGARSAVVGSGTALGLLSH